MPRPSPSGATPPRIALLAAAVALLCAPPLRAVNVDYTSLAGLKAAGFQKFLDDAKDQGYEPVYINGYSAGDHTEYAGVAIKDPDKKPFESKYDMTDDEYRDFFKEMSKKAFRPTCVSGYHTKEGPRFAAVWVSTKFDKHKVEWKARHGQPEKEFDDTVKALGKEGYVPTYVTAYQAPDGAVRYTSLFIVTAKSVDYETKKNMTAEAYQDQLDKWQADHWRVTRVHVYDSPDGLRFLATARLQRPYDDKFVWQEHHDMTGNQYQKLFDKLGADAFRPACICGYRDGGAVKFAVIWSKEK